MLTDERHFIRIDPPLVLLIRGHPYRSVAGMALVSRGGSRLASTFASGHENVYIADGALVGARSDKFKAAGEADSVTIKDVAREAKVSVATVSRVLNGSVAVASATRERVERVAARLHYVPSGAARALVNRRTGTVGLLLRDVFGEFFSELVRGVDLAAREHDLQLLISSSRGSADEAAAALRAMHGRVDGVLIMSPNVDAPFLRRHVPGRLPIVLLDNASRVPRCARVNIDDYGGAQSMTRHLLALGHRKLALVEGPDGNYGAQERRRGFAEAVAHHRGATARYLPGDFSRESGYRAARALLAEPTRPDAVFAVNDMMAIGCLAAFDEAGVRVPEDIAVVGFDDIPMAAFTRPPLTTVQVQIARLGRIALERLIDQIEAPNQRPPRATTMPCEVVTRASCGSRTGSPRHAAQTVPFPSSHRGPVQEAI